MEPHRYMMCSCGQGPCASLFSECQGLVLELLMGFTISVIRKENQNINKGRNWVTPTQCHTGWGSLLKPSCSTSPAVIKEINIVNFSGICYTLLATDKPEELVFVILTSAKLS